MTILVALDIYLAGASVILFALWRSAIRQRNDATRRFQHWFQEAHISMRQSVQADEAKLLRMLAISEQSGNYWFTAWQRSQRAWATVARENQVLKGRRAA